MRMTSPTAIFAALLAASASSFASTTKDAAKHVLPFIEDDYASARAAKAANKPMFVEGWAPW